VGAAMGAGRAGRAVAAVPPVAAAAAAVDGARGTSAQHGVRSKTLAGRGSSLACTRARGATVVATRVCSYRRCDRSAAATRAGGLRHAATAVAAGLGRPPDGPAPGGVLARPDPPHGRGAPRAELARHSSARLASPRMCAASAWRTGRRDWGRGRMPRGRNAGRVAHTAKKGGVAQGRRTTRLGCRAERHGFCCRSRRLGGAVASRRGAARARRACRGAGGGAQRGQRRRLGGAEGRTGRRCALVGGGVRSERSKARVTLCCRSRLIKAPGGESRGIQPVD